MANLVEDWEVQEDYAGDKQSLYQIPCSAKGVEIRALPLQHFQRWSLTSRNDITRNAEYALQNAKRKTQPE